MIPKIIHYCWLSGEQMPELLQQCIASWKRYLPEYEIRLWNMTSFDYDSVPFTRDALANKKWAFVSDYVRLYALYNYGGIYLDSDVFVFGKLDKLLQNRLFTGLEMRDKEHTQIYCEAAIIGAEPGHPFIKKCLDIYEKRSFIDSSGNLDLTPIPTIMSAILEETYNWKREDKTQELPDGITIYSTETIANINCRRTKSVKLYHLNNRSWLPQTFKEKTLRLVKRILRILKF